MTAAKSGDSGKNTYTGIPTYKVLLWLSIVSMIMIFAGLTSGYIVRQAESNWQVFELPKVFYVSTALIFMSSFSMFWAWKSVKNNHQQGLRTGLIITLALGLGFCYSQFMGWTKLVDMGIYFTGNPSGSFLYVITAVHLAHLLGGMTYLVVISARSLQGRYHSGNYLPVELCSIYWHFLDGLWIYLFVFLLYFR